MAIPQNITNENIIQALKYIDQHGIPEKNKSTRYELISEEGKKYPPKYVIAIADHLTNSTEISTDNFVSVEAKNFLVKMGFNVNMKQYELTITKNEFESNNPMFDINNIGLGNNYEAVEAYFKKSDGQIVRRNRIKNERTITGQTLPRIAFQVFETQISNLSLEEKLNFPICQYTPNDKMFRGIFTNENDFNKANNNTIEKMVYENGPKIKFYIYCWNIFSTLRFVQECLKRFGEDNDKFVLIYREKEVKTKNDNESSSSIVSESNNDDAEVETTTLMARDISINTILYGPPGTGKTYNTVLYAVAICKADVFTLDALKEKAKTKEGYEEIHKIYDDLVEQGRIVFTTFHQSYGYEDFIEGIKPDANKTNTVTYKIEPGIFKKFCKPSFEELWEQLVNRAKAHNSQITISRSKGNRVLEWNEERNKFYDTSTESLSYQYADFDSVKKAFDGNYEKNENSGSDMQKYHNAVAIAEILKENMKAPKVFIIDEINRGNVSKIFGELITLIEEEKRGKSSVVLPYSQQPFTVPENVYILGTMNTADRSLALMDTALRRRFDFVEMMPDADLFEGITVKNEDNGAEVKIDALLKTINKRIEYLYDREHTIGHAYFKELLQEENRDMPTLRKIFIKKIIPLLQEYFYDDYERIRLVLGDNLQDKNMCFIKESQDASTWFPSTNIDFETKAYEVNKEIETFTAERFIAIYDGVKTTDE